MTEYPVPTPGDPTEIAVGPDNNLWYTDPAANLIGRITPSGSITEFTGGPRPRAAPTGIAKGPDGALWFTEADAGKIGRITTAGAITEFSSGISGSSSPQDIEKGPDGNLWFTESANPGAIGRITPDGRCHRVHRRPDRRLGPAGDRRRPGRQSLVHGVQEVRAHRPDHDRRRHHRVLERPRRHHEPVRDRGRPGREHVVHGQQRPGPRGPDHAAAARSRHGRGLDHHHDARACAARSARTRRRPSTASSTGPRPRTATRRPSAYAGSGYDLNQVASEVEGLAAGHDVPLPAGRGERRRRDEGRRPHVHDRVAPRRRRRPSRPTSRRLRYRTSARRWSSRPRAPCA